MNAPGITRHRRPFLAPIWIAALAALVVGTALFIAVRLAALHLTTVSTVIVVRHAEKAALPATDPPLSPQGELRAARLAELLGASAGPGRAQVILSSDALRARSTAAPLAARLGLAVETVPAGDVPGLLRRIHDAGRGKTTVVVGHGDTVPRIVAGLSGGRFEVRLREDEFGTAYVVTLSDFGPPSLLQLNY